MHRERRTRRKFTNTSWLMEQQQQLREKENLQRQVTEMEDRWRNAQYRISVLGLEAGQRCLKADIVGAPSLSNKSTKESFLLITRICSGERLTSPQDAAILAYCSLSEQLMTGEFPSSSRSSWKKRLRQLL